MRYIKSFIYGFGSAFELMPRNHQNQTKSETQYMDEAWNEVGKDLRIAMERFDNE